MKKTYDWSPIKPFLDVEMRLGTRNRKSKFITLREFKRKIEVENCSLRKIIHEGVNKHLIHFYSKFSQGKINLSKEDFIREYQSGLNLNEIADKYHIQHADITFLRQIYSIPCLGPTYQNRKRTEEPLTQRQKDLIYGSLMGDAKRQSTKFNSSVGFVHGTGQEKYINWKHEELKNICSDRCFSSETHKSRHSDKMLISYRFFTKANSDVENIVEKFYKNNKREVSEDILKHLSPFSVAVWYMDDGYASWSYASRCKSGHNIKPEFKFCTDSFSKESCGLIVDWFKKRWGISCRLRERKRQNKSVIGYRILIEDNQKFIDLIEPHILPFFKYKIDYNTYVKMRENADITA